MSLVYALNRRVVHTLTTKKQLLSGKFDDEWLVEVALRWKALHHEDVRKRMSLGMQ